MDTSTMIVVLALGTIAAVVVFAMISKRKTAERLRADTQKSTLAADAPSSTARGTRPVDT